jgi:endoglucanase
MVPTCPLRRLRPATVAGTLVIASVMGCSSASEAGPALPDGRSVSHRVTGGAAAPKAGADNPLTGRTFYVDRAGDAAVLAARWDAQGRRDDARELRKIADRPVADWVTAGPVPTAQRVGALVGRAEAAGQLPVLVAYNIPHRDCGSYSGGGAASPQEYQRWIRAFARGIRNRPVVVIVEPDAVAHLLDGCAQDAEQRNALLRDAIAVLKATGSAVVYLDAGNPGWITDAGGLASALRQAGIGQADGFSLNVANFNTTADTVGFGDRISDALGGDTHFVVDTSRNGNGPAPDDGHGPRWCNPPGRALGTPPTAATGRARVDAFLWIKRPGESDGSCRPGEPAAGKWWPQYALDLARRSR